MTKRDQKTLAHYCRHVANALGLCDWTLHFNWDEPADGDNPSAGASIDCIEGRKHAILRWSKDFREYEPDKQRHYVVHEMVHCHLAETHHLVEEDLLPHLGRPAWDLFSKAHLRAIEYAVDGLADVIAPSLPAIDW